jgi:hypothetical protein
LRPVVRLAQRPDWEKIGLLAELSDEEFLRRTDRWPAFLGPVLKLLGVAAFIGSIWMNNPLPFIFWMMLTISIWAANFFWLP